MIEGVHVEPIKLPFAKGMVTDYGEHLMPPSYWIMSKNVRVSNSTLVRRKWYRKIASVNNNTPIKNLVSCLWHLYAVVGETFYEIDLEDGTFTQKITGLEYAVSTVVYWPFIIICDWESDWRVFDVNQDTEVPMTDMYSGAKPRFWESYWYSTFLVWWGTNNNILYKSMEWGWIIVESEDQEDERDPKNVYNYTGNWSCRYSFRSPITGIVANRENLFVFTENSIEIMSDAEVTSWWYMTLISQPIAGTNVPANPRMIVKADDLIFFRTKDNMMKSISYMQWVSELMIWEVTHSTDLSMKQFCESLDEDQSDAFWYYNRKEKAVYRHLKERWEPYPNVVLVYDIGTQSFYIDTNKFFSCQVNHGFRYFVWDASIQTVYEDCVGDNDNWNPILWERKSALFTMWSPDYRKEFRQVNIYWEKDEDAEILVYVLVDGKEVFEWRIGESWLPISGTASKPLASKPLAFEFQPTSKKTFEYLISRWSLRYRGKNIQLIFRWESTGDFCLTGIEIWYKNLYDSNVSDKAKQRK